MEEQQDKSEWTVKEKILGMTENDLRRRLESKVLQRQDIAEQNGMKRNHLYIWLTKEGWPMSIENLLKLKAWLKEKEK